MYCTYYNRASFFDRLKGIKGYCELQKCDIMGRENAGRIPYVYCEGRSGRSNIQCGVFIHFAEGDKIKHSKSSIVQT